MELFKESIVNQLKEIIILMDESGLYHNKVILHDIIEYGADGIIFHMDDDLWDMPEELEIACDDLSYEVWEKLEIGKAVYEFAEKLSALYL